MVIAPGETAYFNCFARGFDVSWDIVRTSIRNERSYEERGINISSEEFPANTTRGLPWHNITMTVDGRISNNDTGISCTATGHRTGDHVYQEGTLTIAG